MSFRNDIALNTFSRLLKSCDSYLNFHRNGLCQYYSAFWEMPDFSRCVSSLTKFNF